MYQTSGVYPGLLNINENPLFVDGPLGNYYLSQVAAGQASTSACVDHHVYGSLLYCRVEIGDVCLDDLTTRTDHVPDSSWADIGYHCGRPYIFACDFEIGRLSDWSTWSPM